MCGISGFYDYSYNGQYDLDTVVRTMSDQMYHRGPDDSDSIVFNDVHLALAHRRLSIQDLSEHGRQPMWSASRDYCIVFNGEIYNFLDIRQELEELGHKFTGHSDTEVLLAAITQWGIEETLSRSEGMFAFCLYDKKSKTLILARDRIGEKPLYYGFVNNQFVFASELKAIKANPNLALDIDSDALATYLKYGYVHAPLSIYKNIYKLVPGTFITVSLEQARVPDINPYPDSKDTDVLSPITYWSVKQAAEQGLTNPLPDELSTTNLLEETLLGVIEKQMISDVSLGAFLSGGIDSSTVVALMQSISDRPVNTFTIGFDDKNHNEAEFAKAIASHIGTQHTELYVTPNDALSLVEELPRVYDEPFSDASQIPTILVSRLARQNVTVSLSGDGGDELFSGYNRYNSAEKLWNKLKSIPYPLRQGFSKLLSIVSPSFIDGLYSLLSRNKTGLKSVGLKYQKLTRLLGSKDIYTLYTDLISYWPNVSELLRGQSSAIDIINSENTLGQTDSFLNQAMYWDQTSYLPGDNLTKVDRASMSVSLETRLPLLSHKVIELAWRIPISMKLKNNKSKWVLREVLYRHVPESLIDRPKMGFSTPIDSWIRTDLKDWACSLLSAETLNRQGYFNANFISRSLKQHLSGKRQNGLQLWNVLMFQTWLETQ